MHRTSLLAALVVVAVGVVVGGIAYAAIPNGNLIQGCYAKDGQLSVIGSNPNVHGGKCGKGETALEWNQAGTPGTPGAPGVSPTVAQLPVGDPNCLAGGASITDAAAHVAYACNGQNGHDGTDGQPFSGTFASGDYSISVTDTGITLKRSGGPQITLAGDDITVKSTGTAKVEAVTNLSLKGLVVAVDAAAVAKIRGAATTEITGGTVSLNGCAKSAAGTGDTTVGTAPDGGGLVLSTIVTGTPTVCIG